MGGVQGERSVALGEGNNETTDHLPTFQFECHQCSEHKHRRNQCSGDPSSWVLSFEFFCCRKTIMFGVPTYTVLGCFSLICRHGGGRDHDSIANCRHRSLSTEYEGPGFLPCFFLGVSIRNRCLFCCTFFVYQQLLENYVYISYKDTCTLLRINIHIYTCLSDIPFPSFFPCSLCLFSCPWGKGNHDKIFPPLSTSTPKR